MIKKKIKQKLTFLLNRLNNFNQAGVFLWNGDKTYLSTCEKKQTD